MRYFLGIDGGATKTEAVIINEQGKLIAQTIGDPVNYHQGGIKQTANNLEKVINKALSSVKLQTMNITSAVFGLAGFDSEQDKIILQQMAKSLMTGDLADRVKVVSDVEIAFKSCFDIDYGIVLIGGTGTNCYGRGKNNQQFRSGGWGWLLGDQTSGFALGHMALQVIMKAFDGREEKTLLTELVLHKLKLNHASDIVDWAYQKDVPVAEIAELAPLVFQAFKKGDRVAINIVKEFIGETMLVVKTVAAKINLTDEQFCLGLIGGLFKEELMVELVRQELKKVLPKAKIVLPKIESVIAAAYMAKDKEW